MSQPVPPANNPHYAAIDLGSNSFHMLIARYRNGVAENIDREKEMVQIAKGMTADGYISEPAQDRALACLSRFAERINAIPNSHIRAVGTKALRMAKNSRSFLAAAEKALGQPIQIISGFEEARLIYKGIAHDIAHNQQQRLVIDIGGGSTEFIIGCDEEPLLLDSLSLGCVTFASRYFPNNEISVENFAKAKLAAREEIEQIRREYIMAGWNIAIGASGTIRAIAQLRQDDASQAIIKLDELLTLEKKLIKKGKKLLEDLSSQRRMVLPSGLAILIAIFEELNISELQLGDGTLKEGLIYDTIGRRSAVDIRDHTVKRLVNHYQIDQLQALNVQLMTEQLLSNLNLEIPPEISAIQILHWAAQLHEIGLSISHSGFHRHGAYLLSNLDMAGFSRVEQRLLATLVGLQRRKWNLEQLQALPENYRPMALQLSLVLRLATVLCRSREPLGEGISPQLTREGLTLSLQLSATWLETHPLTQYSLQREQEYLKSISKTTGLSLKIN